MHVARMQANEIMRPAAKEYFRDTTDYTKRLGLAAGSEFPWSS